MKHNDFTAQDLPMLNRLIGLHPDFQETAAVVRQVTTNAKYPINSFDDLAETLGGEQATLTIRGRATTLAELRGLVPAYYFPIGSERDLVAKIADMRKAGPSAANVQATAQAMQTNLRANGGDGGGGGVVEHMPSLPANASKAPTWPSQQCTSSTRTAPRPASYSF